MSRHLTLGELVETTFEAWRRADQELGTDTPLPDRRIRALIIRDELRAQLAEEGQSE